MVVDGTAFAVFQAMDKTAPGIENRIEIMERDGAFLLQIENPSAGDPSRIGRAARLDLDMEQAGLLRDWLTERLNR